MAFSVLVAGCGAQSATEPEVWTLYREEATPERGRAHVATFDANQSEPYNRDNCFTAQEHFQRDASVRFWCEAGRYHR